MRERWRFIASIVVAGAVAALVLAVVIDSVSLAGESIAVALLTLGALVVGGPSGPRAGRMLAGAGLGVLALDAHLSARPSPVDPISPGWAIAPPGTAEQADWVRESLTTQVQTHGASLLGVVLLNAGVLMIARARPAGKRGGDTWSAWVVASAIALVVLVPGVLLVSQRGIGAVVGLPILVFMGAAAALPAAAGHRGWRVAVPATAGALLLAVAALSAHVFSFEPLPPEPSSSNVVAPVLTETIFLDLGDTDFLDSHGFLDRSGLFGGSLPALATLAAVLVLATIPLSREHPSAQPPAEPS